MKKITKKQKEKIKHMIVLISAIMFLFLIITIGMLSVRQKAEREKLLIRAEEEKKTIEHLRPDIDVDLLTYNANSRPGKELKHIRYIVIHYTANPGTDAKANRDYFESRKNMPEKYENKVSAHFIIGIEGEIVQCIPLTEIAYASNKRNTDSISIECCHPEKNGKFTDETYDSLVKLSGWLSAKYKIKKKHIIRHYDVTGKMCPKYYVKHRKMWKKLKEDIYLEKKRIDNFNK